jgi:hypothetical protein
MAQCVDAVVEAVEQSPKQFRRLKLPWLPPRVGGDHRILEEELKLKIVEQCRCLCFQ